MPLVYFMIVATLVGEYLQERFGLPRQLAWLPEIIAAGAALLVLFRIAATRFSGIDGRYLVVLAFLLIHVVVGIIVNHLPPGVVFAGMRIYLKGMPFFLLPLLVVLTEKDLKRQM